MAGELQLLKRTLTESKIPSQVYLYHGTTKDTAVHLSKTGWKTGDSIVGANAGNPRLLYLTTTIDNARWYAEENGGDTVIRVKLNTKDLIFDPEDGNPDLFDYSIDVAIEKLMKDKNTIANFATSKPIPSKNIKIIKE